MRLLIAGRLAVSLFLATLLSASAMPPVQAATTPASAQASAAQPVGFTPGRINTRPVGSPIEQIEKLGLAVGTLSTPGLRVGEEIVERRTQYSTTSVGEHGVLQRNFHTEPVNFKDANGVYRKIDNRLVALADGTLTNRASPIKISLPSSLAKGSARLDFEGKTVELRPLAVGADPVHRLAPAGSVAVVSSAKATYREVYPHVDIAYSAMSNGLKEDIILKSAQAPAVYEFELKVPAGLTVEQQANGTVRLNDASGDLWGQLARPFVHDARYPSSSSPLDGVSYEAITMSITPAAQGHVVRITLDPHWLKAPGREFPVTIDPTLIAGASQFSFITNEAANSNFDTHPLTAVCVCPFTYRTVAKPNPDLATFFKEPVQIIGASISLNSVIDSTGQAPAPVGVYEITSPWSSSQVSWNERFTGLNWGSPGGDLVAQPETVLNNITGPTGLRTWSIMSMAKAWVSQQRPFNGVAIKYLNEDQFSPPVYFDGANPVIGISWVPQMGLHAPYPFESFSIGEKRQAMVSLATGALKLSESDLALVGTGMDATAVRGYDSRALLTSSMGLNWGMWPQSRERLYPLSNGDVWWQGGPERSLIFEKVPGSFKSPQGYRGTLSGTGPYTLLMHDSAMRYEFAASGHLSKMVDRNGNRIEYFYTAHPGSGELLLTSLRDTKGRVTTFTHQSPTKLTRITDPAGRQHNYSYTGDRLSSYTDPAGKVTTYEYLAVTPARTDTPISKIIDPNGNQTRFSYLSAAQHYAQLYPNLPPGVAPLDFGYRLSSLTRVTNNATGAGHTWTFDFSVPGKTKLTDPNAHTTTYTLDPIGRVTEVADPLGNKVATSYNAAGFVKTQTDQAGKTTILDYSNDGTENLTKLTTPGATTHSFTYDDTHVFYPKTITSPQLNTITFGYTSNGNRNMALNQLPTQNQLSADYNPNGTLNKSTDGIGNETFFDYFPNGDLQKFRRPLDVGNQSFEYDNLSRMTKMTDAKAQATTYTYDALDRLTQITHAGGSAIINTYDSGGRLTRRDDKTGPGLLDPVYTTRFGYDTLNRQTSKVSPTTLLGLLGSTTFTSTFDGVGNLKSITDPSGTVTYSYDGANRLVSLVEPEGETTTFGYDAAYRPNVIAYPNGVSQTTVYDQDGKVTGITGKLGATTLTSFAYDYSLPDGTPTDMVQKLTDASGTTSLQYDQLDRLTQAATPGGTFNFKLDGNANRLRSSINATTETRYALNRADQLCYSVQGPGEDIATVQHSCAATTSPQGAHTYQYDLNGNLTGQSDGRVLSYNSLDQNVSFKPAGLLALATPMSYLNSGQTERTQAGDQSFKDGPLGLSVATTGLLAPLGLGTTINYVRTPNGDLVSRRTGTTAHYYLFDRLGSVVALTDGQGNALNRYFYDPFGNYLVGTTEQVPQPWQFAAGFKDAFSGYYKFGTRYYDPTLGRWTQMDPSGQDANSYAYAGSNPVNFVDPTGEAFVLVIPAGVAAWKAGVAVAGIFSAGLAAWELGEATGHAWAKPISSWIPVKNRNEALHRARRKAKEMGGKVRGECNAGDHVHCDWVDGLGRRHTDHFKWK
ncbi:MAG: RHS repeat-associated core domain-containing protein [Actinomycetota bacterium]